MPEFQAVVRERAAQQLAARAGHVGPFRNVKVRLNHEPGRPTGATDFDAETWVWLRDHNQLRRGCLNQTWTLTDTIASVNLLNELLALADDLTRLPSRSEDRFKKGL